MELDFDLDDIEDTGVSQIDEFDIMFVLSIIASLLLFVYLFLSF